MNRRFLALLLTLAMVISMVPFSASAANVVESGSCGENLTYTLTDDGVLTVSGTGEMTDYPWVSSSRKITTVIIEYGVTSIADFAFCENSNITSVTIADSVTSIGEWAFCECSGLSVITVPASVTTLGVGAFGGCYVQVSADNPSYCSDENGVLFDKNKTRLIGAPETIEGHYTIPSSVTTVGSEAFFGCSKLTGITIPEGITAIEDNAFACCSGLTEVILPESLTSIGDFAFDECTGLSAITIPASVTEIGGCAFYGCTGLSSIRFAGNAPSFGSGYEYGVFEDVTATVYYPAGNTTWTADVRQNYGGNLTWEADSDDPQPSDPAENPFTDVLSTDYFYEPVLWAFSQGVTTGTTDTTFEPNATCTRGQIVTFLWRSQGSPESQSTYNPFRDVNSGDYFYKAVLWAVENGITSGVSADSFAPNEPCTRGQVATFLWRSKGKPAAATENSFYDVAVGAYYYDAVLWAVEQGVTNGVGPGSFAPDAPCTRGQIVTFLYRANGAALPDVPQEPEIIYYTMHPAVPDLGAMFDASLAMGGNGDDTYYYWGSDVWAPDLAQYAALLESCGFIYKDTVYGTTIDRDYDVYEHATLDITVEVGTWKDNPLGDLVFVTITGEDAASADSGDSGEEKDEGKDEEPAEPAQGYEACPSVPDFGAFVGVEPEFGSADEDGLNYSYLSSKVMDAAGPNALAEYLQLLQNAGFAKRGGYTEGSTTCVIYINDALDITVSVSTTVISSGREYISISVYGDGYPA